MAPCACQPSYWEFRLDLSYKAGCAESNLIDRHALENPHHRSNTNSGITKIICTSSHPKYDQYPFQEVLSISVTEFDLHTHWLKQTKYDASRSYLGPFESGEVFVFESILLSKHGDKDSDSDDNDNKSLSRQERLKPQMQQIQNQEQQPQYEPTLQQQSKQQSQQSQKTGSSGSFAKDCYPSIYENCLPNMLQVQIIGTNILNEPAELDFTLVFANDCLNFLKDSRFRQNNPYPFVQPGDHIGPVFISEVVSPLSEYCPLVPQAQHLQKPPPQQQQQRERERPSELYGPPEPERSEPHSPPLQLRPRRRKGDSKYNNNIGHDDGGGNRRLRRVPEESDDDDDDDDRNPPEPQEQETNDNLVVVSSWEDE